MFKLRLRDYAESDLPTSEQAAGVAKELIDEIFLQWKKGKSYVQGQVETYHQDRGGRFWMARVSHHSDVPFSVFRKGLYENHTDQEVEYIPLVKWAKKLGEVPAGENETWQNYLVHYAFPKFFSDREMTVWVLAVEPDPSVEQFYVISVPSTAPISDKPGLTQGYYCSVERVTAQPDGTVEWIMAQTSNSGGSIPRWVQDKAVSGSVAEDVPHFIAWAKTHYNV